MQNEYIITFEENGEEKTMNSKELWNLLESNNNEDIQSMVTMCIVYLIKKRNLRLKNILKGIKNCIKNMEV